MVLLSNHINRSLKMYWRRRKYQRLNGAITGKSTKLAKFGGTTASGRRFWKIKATPKLRLRIVSPMKIWRKFKNAYMNMMLGLAGNVGYLTGGTSIAEKRIPKARQLPANYSNNNEFENKLIFEIYKAMVASRELSTSTTA